jgi:hypothetical protein
MPERRHDFSNSCFEERPMMQEHELSRRTLMATAGVSAWTLFGLEQLLARGDQPREEPGGRRPAVVHISPRLLTPEDQLTIGPNGAKHILLESPTLLIWVDQMPDARFAHPTQLVLISAQGARVERADWWPVVNGKDLFRDGKKTSVVSPLALE